MSKMNEYSRAYIKEAANLALSMVSIYQCRHCGHPTIGGYCCKHCGSGTPQNSDQEPSHIEL